MAAAKTPLPRDPAMRITALLNRAHGALILQAWPDVCRALESAAKLIDPDVERQWRQKLHLLEGDCRMILRGVYEFERRLTEELRRAEWIYIDDLGPPRLPAQHHPPPGGGGS